MKIPILVLLITILNTGCLKTITVLHEDYCTKYTAKERKAYQTLTGDIVKIDCRAYKK